MPVRPPFGAQTPKDLRPPLPAGQMAPLEVRFRQPEGDDRLAVFWDWSNVTDEVAITRELREMARVGVGRAVLAMTLAHSATVTNGAGMVFLSPRFLSRFRFALDEAARLGIKITGIPSNGWYQGGPWVTPEIGAQMLVWSETEILGPAKIEQRLPTPDKFRPGRFARIAPGAVDLLRPIATLAFRKDAVGRLLAESRRDVSPLVKADGMIDWEVPDGTWVIYRFGHVPNMVRMKQDSPGYGGLQIDHLSRAAMERFLAEVATPLLAAAGPHVGHTLDRLHEDSMELGHYDWTGDLPEQFNRRRGYDVLPLLPLLAGAVLGEGPEPGRVERDFKATIEDLLIEEHFGTLRDFCHRHGLTLVAESGETRSRIAVKGMPVDHVMDEFWTHRGKESDHLVCFNRNAIFAAHVYGQNRNTAEAFTSHQHWMETPAQLKALANEVYALGLNHLTIHGFSSSPAQTPPPGEVYFAGTHFNPGLTWWKDFAAPLTAYFNRCQTMLTAGRPVTDLLYLDGPCLQELIRSNEMLRETARRFWQFDGIPSELLTDKATVTGDGRIALPHGQSYAVLVVADAEVQLKAMRVIERLANDGATIWFQTIPCRSPSQADGPEAEAVIQAIVQRLGGGREPGVYPVGKGHVQIGAERSRAGQFGSGVLARKFYDGLHAAAMDQLRIDPAFSYRAENPDARLFFCQRQAEGTDIYFVANAGHDGVRADCTFRIAGKLPERWDPMTGTITPLSEFTAHESSTMVPVTLAAHESAFVVFREPLSGNPLSRPSGAPVNTREVDGPWEIAFEPARHRLESFAIKSDHLFRWDLSADRRIQSFSGTTAYRTQFEWKPGALSMDPQLVLDLGASPTHYELTGAGAGDYEIRENVYDTLCAEVLVNGRSAGVLWCAPYRINVTDLVQSGANTLEIRVTNTWHNWRLASQFTAGRHPWEKKGLSLPPSPSGLLGPVRLEIRTPTQVARPSPEAKTR